MALERSVLTYDIISDLLNRHYGINVSAVQKLKLGTANCYKIYDGNKYYFLKEFQSDFKESSIIEEAKLLDFLSNTDIPVSRFYKTLKNDFIITYQSHFICLQEYIDGQTYGYDDLPERLLPQVGRTLGKLHSSLKNYSLPIDMADKWVKGFSAEKTIEQYDVLIDVAKNKSGDENTSRIIDDMQYKKQLALRCNEYKKYYNGITYCASHGDYQGCQLIFDRAEIKAIVDFSSASSLPVTWEIMRSFVQSSTECRKNANIDIMALREYVSEYMKYSKLTKNDIISMPYVYLFQLARSKYGYPQYLNSDSEDRNGLLQFAFWRTQICREVEKKANTISSELIKLIN